MSEPTSETGAPETVEPTDEAAEMQSNVKVVSASKKRWTPPWKGIGAIVAALAIGFLVFSQIQLMAAIEDTEAQLAKAGAQIVALDSRVAGVSLSVDEVATDVQNLAAAQTSGGGSTPADIVDDGSLPQFVQGAADSAIGLTLGPITGTDGYTGETVTVDPADGNKRVWMVWAHWCPYCQEEMPTLSALYPTMAETYPGVELTTISTSIDPSRGNPLDEYLAAQQFEFPVIVDGDMSLAAQVGVSAFPFWVVTDGDGTVLVRVAGYMDEDRLAGLLSSVSEWEA